VTLLICWLVFPVVMGILSLGCGLLVERAARTRIPAELLVPMGFAAIVTLTLFATLTSVTASLALPAVLALSVVGLAASLPPTLRRLDGWALAAGLGVFAVYAAPVVLSGAATFTGYLKLDDTATFLALADRALEHGRSLDGLAPSSYEATLAINLPFYPLGSLLPLGIGARVVGQDTAWVFQPYLAFLAALLGLALYRLSGLVLVSRPARAVAAFLAAQAALLYGYSLWGGVKEVAAASLLALAAALTSDAFNARRSALAFLPLAVAAAGLVGVLSIGALVWLAPVGGIAAISVLRRRSGVRPVALIAAGVVLLIPSLVVARLMLGAGVLSSIRDKAELGNLVHSLSPLQIFGVWPAGDFRFRPERIDVTYVLVAVLAATAVAGLAVAATRRAWEVLLYVVGALGGALIYGLLASPWIEAKALAMASPALVLTALVGALTLFNRRRVEGIVAVGLIALGIGWSNFLAFRDVTLAPRDQLAELEAIGEQSAGQGPSLMTEYQPYGVRHFLRRLDPEGASELRRRPIPLRDGSLVPKGGYADLAAFRPQAVHAYRTLVLRRTPVGTRRPVSYRLVWQRRFYEVWQRPEVVPVSATRTPPCAGPLEVRGRTFSAPTDGRYEVWVGGSVRGRLTAFVDDRRVGQVRHQLNHTGQYASVGTVQLPAGIHALDRRDHRSRFSPGEGGEAWVTGPLVVTPADRCDGPR
jgi:hypothetical protein